MYEVPIIWRFEGDKQAGRLWMRQGAVLMDMLVNGMSFMGLDQLVLRRYVTPDVHIKCTCCFGIRTVTITVRSGVGEARKVLRECFANTTVALAYVLDVVGVDALTAEEQAGTAWRHEPVCKTCIGVSAYPKDYYCTRGIRYTVAVCDGKGEYLLFKLSKAASTDYTPRCPGELVLVAQHRTPNLPAEVLAAADKNPMDKGHPFTRRLAVFPDECVSILPYTVGLPRYNETEGQ